MKYQEAHQKLKAFGKRIAELRQEMRAIHQAIEPQEVKDYVLPHVGGSVRLSELFGNKDTLFVVHNMGAGCPYCTLWADGFNGAYEHLRNRAGFVVSSPDAPEQQKKFAGGRGWKFPMVSYQGTTFGEDMGYHRDGTSMPGVSVFKRRGDQIVRVADTSFSPGDDFCHVWHFFDLIPEGAGGWQPQFQYSN